jgi:hypothetical protein
MVLKWEILNRIPWRGVLKWSLLTCTPEILYKSKWHVSSSTWSISGIPFFFNSILFWDWPTTRLSKISRQYPRIFWISETFFWDNIRGSLFYLPICQYTPLTAFFLVILHRSDYQVISKIIVHTTTLEGPVLDSDRVVNHHRKPKRRSGERREEDVTARDDGISIRQSHRVSQNP